MNCQVKRMHAVHLNATRTIPFWWCSNLRHTTQYSNCDKTWRNYNWSACKSLHLFFVSFKIKLRLFFLSSRFTSAKPLNWLILLLYYWAIFSMHLKPIVYCVNHVIFNNYFIFISIDWQVFKRSDATKRTRERERKMRKEMKEIYLF